MTSDTDEQIRPRPATLYNDINSYPADPSVYDNWDGYNMTSNFGPIDETSLHN